MEKEKAKKQVKDILATPKGMRDIMNEEYYLFQGFFEKAQEVAMVSAASAMWP